MTDVNHITIVLPFDIGRSYSFRPRSPEGLPENVRLPPEWSIGTSLLEQPLGIPFVWHPSASSSEARPVLKSLCWCYCANIEVQFYPVGVAVMVLRGALTGRPLAAPWETARGWEDAAQTYPALTELATAGVRDYTRVMGNHGEIRSFRRRPSPTLHRPAWAHPIFAATCEPDSANRPLLTAVDRATVAVGWRCTEVKSTNGATFRQVEQAMTSAAVTWQALSLLDECLSSFAHELVQLTPALIDAELHGTRVFVKQTTDGARPICWTLHRDLVNVIDLAHQQWKTSDLCLSVTCRAELVTMICEQRLSRSHERLASRVGVSALIIACFSVASATKDVLDLTDICQVWKLIVTASMMLVVGMALGAYLLRGSSQPSPIETTRQR
jgi:hypothetical protein